MSKEKRKARWLFFGKDKYTYDTIDELVNKSMGLAVGEVVTLNGYYSADDGATHKRVIADSDDGSGVELRSGKWANIVHNGEVNVSWFGAKGDGVTDDTEAIQKAIDISNLIMFSNKKYNVLKSVILKSNIIIKGCGNNTIIYSTNSLDKLFKNNINEDIKNVTFDSISFHGNVKKEDISMYPRREHSFNNIEYGKGMINAILIKGKRYKREKVIGTADNINIKNCIFKNIYLLPVEIYGAENISVRNNVFDNCLDVGFVDDFTLDFSSNKISCSRDNGVSISSGCNSVTCSNNIIEYSGYNGIWTAGWIHEGVTYKGPDRCVVSGNIIKYSGHSGIQAKWGITNSKYSDNLIDGCYFANKSETELNLEAGFGLRFVTGSKEMKADNITINNNTIMNCYIGGIKCEYAENINISNNVFINIGSDKDINGEPVNYSKAQDGNFGICFLGDGTTQESKKLNAVVQDNSFRDNRLQGVIKNYLVCVSVDGLDVLNTKLLGTTKNAQFNKSGSSTNVKIIDAEDIYGFSFKTGFATDCNLAIPKKNGGLLISNCNHTCKNIPEPHTGIILSFRTEDIISQLYIGQDAQRVYGRVCIRDIFSEWSGTAKEVINLNTPYHMEKMKQENVYDDYITYTDEKTAYDKQQQKLEQDRQLAYEETLKVNPELTYEEWLSQQPALLPYTEEPRPTSALQKFMDKYL